MDDKQQFKIVLIGSVSTGKTNIALRYVNNEFRQNMGATVGVQFLKKIVRVKNKNVNVTLWDTAGQERYKSLSKVYYKGANGVLIVYDTTNVKSYQDVEGWMKLVNEHLNLSEVVVMIVGNKVDIVNERQVPPDRPIKEYTNKLDIDCREVSAKSGYKIEEVFQEMLEKIYELHLDGQAIKLQEERVHQEQMRKKEAENNQAPIINPASIKKQPQVKNKKTTLENEVKKRDKESKEKKKGCC